MVKILKPEKENLSIKTIKLEWKFKQKTEKKLKK